MGNTAPDKVLSQKLNIITAMSSDGEVWIALTTCNTDSDVLMLFMSQLANSLTKESANWRKSTVFLLDGVSSFLSSHYTLSGLGIVSQERGEPGLLPTPWAEDRPKRTVQLCRCSHRALVIAA